MSPVERVRMWCPSTALALELVSLGVAVSVVPDSVSVASLSAVKIADQGAALPPPPLGPELSRSEPGEPEGCGKPDVVVGLHEAPSGETE